VTGAISPGRYDARPLTETSAPRPTATAADETRPEPKRLL
jgi:hypothetical protein